MQRLLSNMSQEKLGDALSLTFQQVQKYEKGTNRISASRLQQLSKILGVPVSFFFDGAPLGDGAQALGFGEATQQAYISEFMTTTEGLQLTRAFMRIQDAAIRRRVIDLVEALVPDPAKSL
jgi:transcriptional regulator with XRE-family HTH domain